MSLASALFDSKSFHRASDRSLLRWAGVALAAAVWVLGLFPAMAHFSALYVAQLTVAIGAMILVELTAPERESPVWRQVVWLLLELGLAFAVVRTQTSLIRLSLIYLIPASRALLMFGSRPGLVVSMSVWVVYGANVALAVLPARPQEFLTYFSFLLAPYVLAVVLTMALLRQSADRERLQTLYDELREAHEELQILHRQAEESAVNRERNRLAREIHDSVAHYLTVVNLQLEAVEKLGTDQPERAVREAKRARRLTVDCLQEVRRSVAALRSATLEELSLPGALKKLASDFSENTGLEVHLEVAIPEDLQLASDARLALYRAAQEGLTNIQRHAHARTARVVLARQNGNVELAVEDDGVGPGPSKSDGGFGIVGLRERVELLGGQLGFGGAPQGGSRLAVSVPVQHE
jgi:signal transduction histidine kinase